MVISEAVAILPPRPHKEIQRILNSNGSYLSELTAEITGDNLPQNKKEQERWAIQGDIIHDATQLGLVFWYLLHHSIDFRNIFPSYPSKKVNNFHERISLATGINPEGKTRINLIDLARSTPRAAKKEIKQEKLDKKRGDTYLFDVEPLTITPNYNSIAQLAYKVAASIGKFLEFRTHTLFINPTILVPFEDKRRLRILKARPDVMLLKGFKGSKVALDIKTYNPNWPGNSKKLKAQTFANQLIMEALNTGWDWVTDTLYPDDPSPPRLMITGGNLKRPTPGTYGFIIPANKEVPNPEVIPIKFSEAEVDEFWNLFISQLIITTTKPRKKLDLESDKFSPTIPLYG